MCGIKISTKGRYKTIRKECCILDVLHNIHIHNCKLYWNFLITQQKTIF